MTSIRQYSAAELAELSPAEREERLKRNQLLGLAEWDGEHCSEQEELSQLYDRLTANLTRTERHRLTEPDMRKLWDVAESLMTPASRQRLIGMETARHSESNPGDSATLAARVLAESLLQRLTKNPELAGKQARLLRRLGDGSFSEPPAGSIASATREQHKKLPDAPTRAPGEAIEEFEERLGRWQETIGRIRGMAARSAKS